MLADGLDVGVVVGAEVRIWVPLVPVGALQALSPAPLDVELVHHGGAQVTSGRVIRGEESGCVQRGRGVQDPVAHPEEVVEEGRRFRDAHRPSRSG